MLLAGDRSQAIYGFAGADSESIPKLTERFALAALPLNTSFRCAQAVIIEAQKIVPEIRAASWAVEGSVFTLLPDEDEDGADIPIPVGAIPPVVLCRNNAPLAALAVNCLLHRRPVAILGRADFLPQLLDLHEAAGLANAPIASYPALLEVHCRAKVAKRPSLARLLADKAQTLLAIAAAIRAEQGARAMGSEVAVWLDSLYAESGDALPPHGVLFSTGHKSKGLEWESVAILDRDLCGRFAKADWEKEAERNLLYVMITRAKRDLLYIRSEDIEGMRERGSAPSLNLDLDADEDEEPAPLPALSPDPEIVI
jgi:DNA helicase-2/ATP-dependent DNA helicase PcrA